MFDIHCHILPKIDDGAELLETSAEMAKALLRYGVTEVIATPHVPGAGLIPTRPEKIADRYQQLTDYLATNNIPLKLYMSAEHNLDPVIFMNPEMFLVPFGTGEEKSLLIELPWHETPQEVLAERIFELRCRDYNLVLVHPERSPGYDLEWLENNVSAGNFFIQTEASSFFGIYGKKAQAKANELLKHHLVHFVASDSHNVDMCKQYGENIDSIRLEIGEDAAKLWLEDNPRALIEGRFDQIKAF